MNHICLGTAMTRAVSVALFCGDVVCFFPRYVYEKIQFSQSCGTVNVEQLSDPAHRTARCLSTSFWQTLSAGAAITNESESKDAPRQTSFFICYVIWLNKS